MHGLPTTLKGTLCNNLCCVVFCCVFLVVFYFVFFLFCVVSCCVVLCCVSLSLSLFFFGVPFGDGEEGAGPPPSASWTGLLTRPSGSVLEDLYGGS